MFESDVGLVAEWLRRGLQILAPRFDSGRGLHPLFGNSTKYCSSETGGWSLSRQTRRENPAAICTGMSVVTPALSLLARALSSNRSATVSLPLLCRSRRDVHGYVFEAPEIDLGFALRCEIPDIETGAQNGSSDTIASSRPKKGQAKGAPSRRVPGPGDPWHPSQLYAKMAFVWLRARHTISSFIHLF
jgi:hypothetical protein